MLASILILPLLAATSVMASTKDDLSSVFKTLGLTAWEGIVESASQSDVFDRFIDLLTGQSSSNSRRDNSGRTFFVPDGDALSLSELLTLFNSDFLKILDYHVVTQEADNTTIALSPKHTVATTALTDNSTVFLEGGAAQVLVLQKQSDNSTHVLNQPSDVTVVGSAGANIRTGYIGHSYDASKGILISTRIQQTTLA